MKRRKMSKKKKPEKEPTEALLLRPRVQFVEKLRAAASRAQRFITHNQVALEILERYLPLWEEIERDTEAAVRAQFDKVRRGDQGDGPEMMHLEGKQQEHGRPAEATGEPRRGPATEVVAVNTLKSEDKQGAAKSPATSTRKKPKK